MTFFGTVGDFKVSLVKKPFKWKPTEKHVRRFGSIPYEGTTLFSSLVGVTHFSIWFTYGFQKLPYDVSGFQAILNSYKWTTNIWQTACITRAECLQAECLKPPSFSPRYPCDNRPPPWGAKMCFFGLILKCVSVCEKRLRISTKPFKPCSFVLRTGVDWRFT